MLKLLNFFNIIKSSLTLKLIFVSLLATLLPMSLGGIFFFSYSMKKVESEYLNSVSNNLRQLSYSLSNQVDVCEQQVLSFTGDLNLINFLQYGTNDDYSMVNIVNSSIISRLRTLQMYNSAYYSIRLIHRNEKIPNVYDFLYYDPRFNNSWWERYLKSLYRKQDKNILDYYVDVNHEENTYMDFTHSKQKNLKVFSLYYPIYSTYNLDLLAVFEISIKQDVFFKSLEDLDVAKGTELNLVNSRNEVVYSTNMNFKGLNVNEIKSTADSSIVKIDNREYFVSKNYIPEIGCWIVQYSPKALIYQNNSYASFIAFGLLAMLAMIFSMSYFVFKLLLVNFNKLIKTIRLIKQGDFNARVNVESDDEVGELAKEFNDMAQKISELLKKLEDSRKAEREAIYKSFENQINVHFICNALDTIRMTAEMQNERKIANAVELISSYFMYNIYRRTKNVTLAEELKNVNDYLNIYNLIRKDKVEYVIKVSNDIRGHLDNYNIPKFTLQPIVENAIKHGFKDKYSKCLIIIDISRIGDRISISIEDNGKGMDEEKLKMVKNLLNSKKGENLMQQNTEILSSKIGLRNIKERLDINYGFQYTFDIISYADVGTKVIIEIPEYLLKGQSI